MRRRYEDVSSLVQYQLKTNQQGNIEVYDYLTNKTTIL